MKVTMNTQVKVKRGSILQEEVDALLVGIHENGTDLGPLVQELNRLLNGAITRVLSRKGFTGKREQVEVVDTGGTIPAQYILLCGLGKSDEIKVEQVRRALGRGVIRAREMGLRTLATSSLMFNRSQEALLPLEELSRAIVEGTLLALYRFSKYRSKEEINSKHIKVLNLVEEEACIEAITAGAEQARAIAESVYFVRDLVNHPANEMTPTILAKTAKDLSRKGKLRCSILSRRELERLGMGAFLGVARGSHEPPQFIIVEYRGGKKSDKPIVIVGKSITFDSGGISLKPGEGMGKMKYDMSGGAITLGVLKAVSMLKLPLNVVGLLPATENMPGGRATRPGDILRSMSGRTIEIISTDAEGRLTLADGLFYATRYKPRCIIDIATLTGACVVALGSHAIGMLSNDNNLKEKFTKAGEKVWERVWEMPLWDEYYEQIKTPVADIKNTGGREGGMMTAALFLSKFVEGYPWIHLDIAGVAWRDKDEAYIPSGASGIGTRLLIQFLLDTTAE